MSRSINYISKKKKINVFNPNHSKLLEYSAHYTIEGEIDLIEDIHPSKDSIIQSGKYSLIIGITMYSENYHYIDATLEGISENLKELIKAGFPEEKILILIISDGRDFVDLDVYEYFSCQNFNYFEYKDIEKKLQNDIFSHDSYKPYKNNYLISYFIERVQKDLFSTKKMDIVFSLKRYNRGKLDSYFWLFNGFCKIINPDYVILLETGIRLNKEEKSLSRLIIPMIKDENISGTCGKLNLSNYNSSWNFILSAQFFEYVYMQQIEKNFESLFGLISVLPGAFSAYRWESLNNNDILDEYFRTIHSKYLNCPMANRNLAEDRILCFSVFYLKDKRNILKYIADAKAFKQAPENFGEFIQQRRRWMNGANFVFYFLISRYCRIWKTIHFFRQFFIFLLFIYHLLNAYIIYFILSFVYLFYSFVFNKIFEQNSIFPSIIMSFYLFNIFICIITSITLKPKGEWINNRGLMVYRNMDIFHFMSLFLGIFNILAVGIGIYIIFIGGLFKTENLNGISEDYSQKNRDCSGLMSLVFFGSLNLFLPLLFDPFSLDIWFKNIFQYIFLSPTFIIILNIFSLFNIDDVSWGTKNTDWHQSEEMFKIYKIKYLFIWFLLNFLKGKLFHIIVNNERIVAHNYDIKLLNIISYVISGLIGIKLIFGLFGFIKYEVFDKVFGDLFQISERNIKSLPLKSNDNEISPKEEKHHIKEANIEKHSSNNFNKKIKYFNPYETENQN